MSDEFLGGDLGADAYDNGYEVGFTAHRDLTIRRLATLENEIMRTGQVLIPWQFAFNLVEQAIDDIRGVEPPHDQG